jgi:hypothetical protein
MPLDVAFLWVVGLIQPNFSPMSVPQLKAKGS